MTETTDVLVIGGGIAGAGAAARIAAHARVILLEAEDAPGRHSTGRSAAIFIRNYGSPLLRVLNDASAPALTYPETAYEDAAGGPVLTPRGVMTVALEEELPALEDVLATGEGLQRLTGAEAEALFPLLKKGRIAAAALEPEAADIDVDRLLQAELRLLRRRGGRIETKARAQAISRHGGAWRVETPAGVFEAPVLINAAGAWADEIAALAGLPPIGIQPRRRSAAILPLPEGMDAARWPLVDPVAFDWYARPEGGRLMVSPADEDPVPPHDAWPDDMVLAEGLDRFAQAMEYEVTRLERSWAGLRSFAPDGDPVCGFDPLAEGFFWLAGQGGHGIQTSPALNALAAALATGAAPELSPATVAGLSPARFGRD